MSSTTDPLTDSARDSSTAAAVAVARSAGVADPRGLRFGAAITSVVLVVALAVSGVSFVTSAVLLAAQAIVFALGVALGSSRSPYGLLFAAVVRPRIGAPQHVEDARPPRFAQAVGLAFTLIGVVGFTLGIGLLGAIATGLALVAALLNATIGLCLGCEIYLIIRRLAPTSTPVEA